MCGRAHPAHHFPTEGIHRRETTMGSAERQGALWGAAARAWSELNEPHCTPFYETVLDAIEAGPGMALLDAGCGAGLAM